MSQPLALVVEDDADVAGVYEAALQAAGFDTRLARDGRTALAELDRLAPDLIVLDMHLPFVAGTELLKHIRSQAGLRNARVIITTGDAQMAAALEEQVDLALVKPVSEAQLAGLAVRLRSPGVQSVD